MAGPPTEWSRKRSVGPRGCRAIACHDVRARVWQHQHDFEQNEVHCKVLHADHVDADLRLRERQHMRDAKLPRDGNVVLHHVVLPDLQGA